MWKMQKKPLIWRNLQKSQLSLLHLKKKSHLSSAHAQVTYQLNLFIKVHAEIASKNIAFKIHIWA